MTAISTETWTEVVTTTTDTLCQAKSGRILVTTTDPADSNFDEEGNSVLITDNEQINGLFVVPAGLTIWAKAINFSRTGADPVFSYIQFGV